MPDDIGQLNILMAALMIITVLVNAVVMILTPVCAVKTSRRDKAARAVLFAINCIILLLGAAYVALKITNQSSAGSVIDDGFGIVTGEGVWSIPVISAMFAAINRYALYGMVGSFALCFACAGIAVQIIIWATAGKNARSSVSVKASGEEPSGETKPAAGKQVAEDGTKTAAADGAGAPGSARRVRGDYASADKKRVLRGKTIVKSDAEKLYLSYLEDKKQRENL